MLPVLLLYCLNQRLLVLFWSILLGLVAELLARTYHESQAKPTYNVKKVIRDKAISEPQPEREVI